MQENKTYRIRAKVGDETENVINVKLDQHYDSFEILSLKIDQENFYKTYESDYGVVVGRVIANGGFGVPNAKVSIFIESDNDDDIESRIFYPYKSPRSKNNDGIRYNLLTDFLDKACYQNVGTFPNKRLVLDNDDVIDVFDKYYRYTTVTNNAGDYMIFGVPTGSQRLHVDIDLSDIGMLSQRPRDMVYKGYDINLFDSPNKFKQDTNLDSLAQIKTQDLGLYVYPFWGDTSDGVDNIAVTRADIQLDYKFEPTCVFMGSIITDTGSNAIGKNCTSTEKAGKMSELIAGEGSIEMIRKTYDGKVEEFQVKGNRVIDGDGVWCYQIPMNLDYIMTDEFGNIAPSDNPEKGIPTRTRVRFRISLDDAPDDNTARKRCRYLVPNNPRLDEERYPQFTKTKEPDYEFGSRTREESFKDLLWNKVYTVKNYVPRLQKNRKVTDRKHTGIKLINHHEANNPMPYNNVDIKLGFTYRMMCIIFKIFINMVQFLNQIFTILSLALCAIYDALHGIAVFFTKKACFLGICPLKPLGKMFDWLAGLFWAMIIPCVGISSEMCGGNTTHNYTFYPGCGNLLLTGKSAGELSKCITRKTDNSHKKKEEKKIKDGEIDESERTEALMGGTRELYNCVETSLAEDNDTISLNFQNDWINGTLYAPMWFRKITKKRRYLFGLIKRRAKDQWCEGEKTYTRKILRVFNPCSPVRPGIKRYTNFDGKSVTAHYMNFSDSKNYPKSCRSKCHESTKAIDLEKGLIVKRQTMLGQDVYYYKPVEYGNPTDIVMSENKDIAHGEPDFGNGSVKILFATDIVLLGSLNDCDIHGVPQFFKSLEPSTFQMPPNLLFTDNEMIINIVKGSSGDSSENDPDNATIEYDVTEESVSEMTGMDWGNFNEDICGKGTDSQDSGLFYSIGCSTIEMKPKSCINMSRICEFGVSLDEMKAFKNEMKAVNEFSPQDEVLYDSITPDGFISKDELYNDDERSLFATLNINGLETERNPESGLMEYVFKHVVVNNFDMSLYEYMAERQRKCGRDMSQKYNYTLEEFSEGYYDFRLGRAPYFYDGGTQLSDEHKLPRYENSFYFYFGLNPGKTAIDKFNSQFTSNCENDNAAIDPIDIEAVGNSWCSDMDGTGDGYVAFNLSYIDLPCDIVIRSASDASFGEVVIEGNEDEMFYVANRQIRELEDLGYVRKYIGYDADGDGQQEDGEYLSYFPNGTYEVTITDNNGEIIMTTFSMKPDPMYSYVVGTDFYESDNVLIKKFVTRAQIALDEECKVCNSVNGTRRIGGTIGIVKPYNSRTGEKINEYRIDVICKGNTGWNLSYHSSGSVSENCIHLMCDDNDFIIVGLPKGGETYTVTITELCDGDESGNLFIEDVKIKEKSIFKLYINGTVDYDVIKHWDSGFNLTNASITEDDGITGTANFKTEGTICDKWWHMSDPNNYMWCYYQPYIDIDNQVSDLSKIFKDAVDELAEDLANCSGVECMTIIANNFIENVKLCPLYANVPADGAHFFYTDIPFKQNDGSYTCSDSNGFHGTERYEEFITKISNTIVTLGIKNGELDALTNGSEWGRAAVISLMSLCEDALELLNEIDNLKTSFVNDTKSAFQLSCPECTKSIYFTVDTKDKPVTYHGAYVQEEIDDVTGLYHLYNGNSLNATSWSMYYTKDGAEIDFISVPTISYKESERFGHDDSVNVPAENLINLDKRLCLAVDNANTSESFKGRVCNFIAVINGRANTIPNDVCVTLSNQERCRFSPNGFRDKVLTCNYFGYHIIDKIFETPYMAWSYVNQVPYFRPVKNGCIDENKAGVSMCMNGLFASKMYNGNPTEHHLVGNGVYDTIFKEQSLGRFTMKISTVMVSPSTTIPEMEDEMPTRRYVVGSDADGGLLSYNNFKVTDSKGKAHEDTDNGILWDLYTRQYVPMLNTEMDLTLEDENGCQIVDSIDGRLRVELEPTSVNLSSTKLKDRRKGSRLDVRLVNTGNSNDELYLVFNVSQSRVYPLNLSEKIAVYFTKDVDSSEFNDLVDPNGDRYIFETNSDGEFTQPDAEEYYYENDYGEEVLITPDNVNDLPSDAEIYHKVEEDRLDDPDIAPQSQEYSKEPEVPCRKTMFDCEMTSGDNHDGPLFADGVRYLFSYYNQISDSSRFFPFPFGNSLSIQNRSFGKLPATMNLQSKYVEESTEKEKTTYGYSNTGDFTFREMSENDFENAYYVIGVTDNNVRTISPVYDFCYLCAKLIFGIVYTRVETTNDDGDVDGYNVLRSPKATFDLGNVVTGDINPSCVRPEQIKYYFYYYPYDINFECKLDEANMFQGAYTHAAYKLNPMGYTLFDVDDSTYDALLKAYKSSKGKVSSKLKKNTTIEAYDVTGLKHLPDWVGCKGGNWQTGFKPCSDSTSPHKGCLAYEMKTWVTITWVTNGGEWKKSSNCDYYVDADCECIANSDEPSCFYDSDSTYVKLFEKGDTYNPCNVGTLRKDGCGQFGGWATSYDSNVPVDCNDILLNGDPEESMIYYAIWPCDFVTVTWVDCNGIEIQTEEGVKKGIVYKLSDMPKSTDPNVVFIRWYAAELGEGQSYDDDDLVWTQIDDEYEITGETVFKADCGDACRPSMTFYNCIDIGKYTIPLITLDFKVYADYETYELSQKYPDTYKPIRHIITYFQPDNMGSYGEMNDHDVWYCGETFSEGNVFVIEILDVEAGEGGIGCSIYSTNFDSNGGPDCSDWADPILAESVVIGDKQPVIIGQHCMNSNAKIVLTTNNGVDCSCSTPLTVRWMKDCENNVLHFENYVCYGDYITPPVANPKMEGCLFDYWDDGSVDGSSILLNPVTSSTPNVDGVITICAQYKCDGSSNHTVEFYAGQTCIRSYTVEDRYQLTDSDVPYDSEVDPYIPQGEEWDGTWVYKVALVPNTYVVVNSRTRDQVIGTEINADARFIASFSDEEIQNQYTIKYYIDQTVIDTDFIPDDGSVRPTVPTYNDVVNNPNFPQGYTFESPYNWRIKDTNTTYTESYINNNLMVNQNFEFVAVLTPVDTPPPPPQPTMVTVSYEYNFPSEVTTDCSNPPVALTNWPTKTDEVESGTTIIAETPPTLCDYGFAGWDVQMRSALQPGDSMTITTDTTFVGGWNRTSPYTLRWRITNYSDLIINSISIRLMAYKQGDSAHNTLCSSTVGSGGGIPATNGVREGVSASITGLPDAEDYHYIQPYDAIISYYLGNNSYGDVPITRSPSDGVAYICDGPTDIPNEQTQFDVNQYEFRQTINSSCVVDANCKHVLTIGIRNGNGIPTGPFTITYKVRVNGTDIQVAQKSLSYGTELSESGVPPTIPPDIDFLTATGNIYAYTLTGWLNNKDPHGRTVIGDETYTRLTVPSVLNVYFRWGDPNNTTTERTATYNTIVSNIPQASDAPYWANHTFIEWSPDPSITTIDETNNEFYGVWSDSTPVVIPYTVSFVAYGNDLNETLITEYTGLHNTTSNGNGWYVPSEVEIFTKVDSNVYNFSKWVDANGLDIDPYSVQVSGETKFKALMVKKTFTVKFDYDATDQITASETTVSNVEYGSTLESTDVPAVAAVSGYDFLYWFKDNGTTPLNRNDIMAIQITANTTFYGQWQQQSVPQTTVTFKVKDDDDYNVPYWTMDSFTQRGNVGSPILNIPSETDIVNATGDSGAYYFDDEAYDNGWLTDPHGKTFASQDTTYVAIVYENTFVAEFDPANGGSVTSQRYKFGSTVPMPSTNPTYSGHTFIGWLSNPGNTLYTQGQSYTHDYSTRTVRFTAQWGTNQVTVSFYSEGALIETIPVNIGGTVTPPSVTVSDPETLRFKDAWIRRSDNHEYSTSELSALPINTGMTFDAKIVALHKVRFYTADNDRVGNTRTVEHNGHVTTPDASDVNAVIAVSSPGKTFMGDWRKNGPYLDNDTLYPIMTKAQIDSMNIVEETNFYARLACTVTFNYGSVSSQSPTSFDVEKRTYLTSSQIPTPNAVSGYTFTGWDGDTSVRITDSITFTAQWTAQAGQMVIYEIPYYIYNETSRGINNIGITLAVKHPSSSQTIPCNTNMGGGLISSGGNHYRTDFYSDAFPEGWTYFTYDSCVMNLDQVGEVVIDTWNVSHNYKVDSTGTYKMYTDYYYYSQTSGHQNPGNAFIIRIAEVDRSESPENVEEENGGESEETE